MVLRWGIYFKHEQYMYWKIEGDDFVEDVYMCYFQLTSWKCKTQYQVKIRSEEMFEKRKKYNWKH